MILAMLVAAAAHAAPVMVVDSYGIDGYASTDAVAGAITVYVANADDDGDADGNDANDGLSSSAPVLTVARVLEITRAGYPDRVLFCAGDTWDIDKWGPDPGADADARAVASWYGDFADGRPILQGELRCRTNSHLIYDGLRVESNDTDGLFKMYGNNASGDDIIVQDCYFTVMVGADSNTDLSFTNVRFYRNVFDGAWAEFEEHTQNLFLNFARGVDIVENVFDHGGWHDAEVGGEPTIYNHNIYIQGTCDNISVENNIIARASASGCQMRAGGDCINNLFLENPVGLDWGYVNSSKIYTAATGITGSVYHNVILGGEDICRPRPSNDDCGDDERGIAMQIGNVASGSVTYNIIAHINDVGGASAHDGILLDGDLTNNGNSNPEDDTGIDNLIIAHNLLYEWEEAMILSAGSYVAVTVMSNTFINPGVDDYMWQMADSSQDISGFSFSDNTYYTDTAFAKFNGSDQTYAAWVTYSGETGSSESNPATAGWEYGVSEYMAALGHSAEDQTVEKFLELAKQNSKISWNSAYTAGAVNAWIRNQYGVD